MFIELLPLLVALAYVVKAYTDYREKNFRRSQTINFLWMPVCGDFFLNHLKSFKLLNFLELDSK